MVIVMKPGVSQEAIQTLVSQLERDHGVTVGHTRGVGCSILGLVGDTAHIDMDKLSMNDNVERVMRVQEPYKKANRKFHPEDSTVDVCGVPIGGGDRFTVIAGPCSVESEEQIVGVARDVKEAGAALLRGGAFKPRTSPYSFQGMGADALELLLEAKADTGLPIVSGAGRRPEYAELRPAEGGGQAVQAHPAQAGAGQHLRGVDHVGGIHHGCGQ